MAEIFEVIMVICFGISWPMNIIRSYKSRTAKGKSILFLVFILVGYIAGIVGKFLNPDYLADFATKWYVLIFYFLNFIMVSIDAMLYFRNRAIDAKNETTKTE
ncbi:MAG: hypothetical protein IKC64_00275 [Clostridia bacterium]|nr:hypothetical protein [Clostridia bacterium]